MINLRTILATVFVATSWVPGAHAQSWLDTITPHEPVLTENQDDALCGPFLERWREIFYSENKLSDVWLDPAEVYPDAVVHRFPPGGRGGLSSDAYSLDIDFDGDGELEVFHLEGDEIGWRYMGVNGYLFEDVAGYHEAVRAYERASERPRAPKLSRIQEFLNEEPKRIAGFAATNAVYLFTLDGAIYSTIGSIARRRPKGGPAYLNRMLPDGGSKLICDVALLPSSEAFEAFTEKSSFFREINTVYGDRRGACTGTMGWRVPHISYALWTVFYRPQAMQQSLPYHLRGETGDLDSRRELRLMSWGLSDPVSWMHYEDLKRHQIYFAQEMTAYYRKHFSTSALEASELAETAYTFIVDVLVYARVCGHSGFPKHLIRDSSFLLGRFSCVRIDLSSAIEAGLLLSRWFPARCGILA